MAQILSCSETIDDGEPKELDGVDSVEYEGTTPTNLNDLLASRTTDTPSAGEGRGPEGERTRTITTTVGTSGIGNGIQAAHRNARLLRDRATLRTP